MALQPRPLTTTLCYLADLKGEMQRKIVLANGEQGGGGNSTKQNIKTSESPEHTCKKTNPHFY